MRLCVLTARPTLLWVRQVSLITIRSFLSLEVSLVFSVMFVLEIMELSIILRMFVLEMWNLLIDPLEMHEKMC